MQINLESNENHSIEAYSEHEIQIKGVVYNNSLLVSGKQIIPDLDIESISKIDQALLEQFIALNAEIVIIGHKEKAHPSIDLMTKLSQHGIGIEAMSIGAACRTFNVLLSEGRSVVAVMIL